MLNIQRFECNMFQENCYVVNDETNECVIIDCGAFYDEEKEAVTRYIKDKKLKPIHLLCTHAHIDHNFGNGIIFNVFGLKPEVSIEDKILMERLREQAMTFIGLNYKEDIPAVGKFFSDNERITFGTHTFSIIATPGHTPGSVFFYCQEEKVAFSGDTLFKMSIGRTDFELGNFNSIMDSLHKIAETLPSDTVILPGHGPETTIKNERMFNPYMK
ncbi:MAG: MBL fold metallo-hydrolase [Prevotellaceae bacterium]|nr:MBL fold metallo-hydrolase [Prevotellaceae bacterium]